MKQSELEMCQRAYELYPRIFSKQQQYLVEHFGLKRKKALELAHEFYMYFAHRINVPSN